MCALPFSDPNYFFSSTIAILSVCHVAPLTSFSFLGAALKVSDYFLLCTKYNFQIMNLNRQGYWAILTKATGPRTGPLTSTPCIAGFCLGQRVARRQLRRLWRVASSSRPSIRRQKPAKRNVHQYKLHHGVMLDRQRVCAKFKESIYVLQVKALVSCVFVLADARDSPRPHER